MKRLKTISLFFVACISLSTHALYAQSSSCADQTNMSVDAYCKFVITPEVFRATGPAANPGSIALGPGTGSLIPFVGGQVTASIKGLGIPNGGKLDYKLYASNDGSGPMLCWGEINFEVKYIPSPETSSKSVMCGLEYEFAPTLSKVISDLDDLCIAPITDIVQTVEQSGEACDSIFNIRTIKGQVDIDGTKIIATLRIDTIIETPLDTGMVVCPLGGPSKLDAIILKCEDIGNAYPTPEVVEAYAAEGIRGAYPYVDKGLDTTITMIEEVIDVSYTTIEQKEITDDNGDSWWVLVPVIHHKDSTIFTPDTTIRNIVIPLKNPPVCNLSLKYSDQEFPGCSGPDSKIMRTWSILDWCNGSLKECVQWIIVETEGPIITPIADGFPAIAPWICTAQYPLSAEVDKGCSESIDVIFYSAQAVIENNNLLTGLRLGEKVMVTATAINDCGHRAVDTFYVTPVDSLPPVAIANDQLNVTLSGDPLIDLPEDRGVAKVYVDAVDAGSHNSGCGDVYKCILLKAELEDPIIIGGVHVEIDGQPIYHSHGCLYDGIYPGQAATKNTPGRPDFPYVICKEFVKFCCASVGQNNVAMVVTNGSDRESRTWTVVNVEDKSSSIIRCPDPVTVGCGEDFEIPRPILFQSICAVEELEMTVAEVRDNCGNGSNVYTWTRGGEFICTTVVIFDASSGFNPYEIKWPRHYNGTVNEGIRRECESNIIVEHDDSVPMGEPFVCSSDGFTGEPVWCSSSCGLVGVNFEDQTLESIDACKKIIRSWTVIDWCSWDPNSGTLDDENDSFDSFTAINDTWLGEGDWLTDKRTTAGEICEECDKPAGNAADIYFRYDTVDMDGYYTFDQIIKIIDFDDPEVTAPDTVKLSIFGGASSKGEGFDDCFTSDVLSASVADFCGDNEIDVSRASWIIQVFELVDGDPVLLTTKQSVGENVTMNTQEGMSGSVHLIHWTARDGCGNNNTASTYVLFVEDKNPTPLCIQNLSTSTMSTDGTATIWASDFDAGSFDNCSEVDMAFKDEDGDFVPSLTITCSQIEDGVSQTFNLELYAIDALGNWDFCNVALRVDDFSDNCDDVAGINSNSVSGQVATAFGDMVEDVMISLSVGMQDMTSVEGKYAFTDLQYNSFDIKAEKNNDYLNGVTSLDALLIQRHMLALSLLDTPYKLIAADINNDGRVSSLDLVDLRKLILGIYDELPRNESWRFVSTENGFSDPLSPFPFTEVINIQNFDGYERAQNFIGVKIGDVNGNAVANSLINADNRSAGKLEFQVENRTIKAGEIVEVPFSIKSFEDITAYQFTFEVEGLKYLDVIAGEIELGHDNIGIIDAYTLTTAWYSSNAVSVSDDLFTLKFEALQDIELKDALAVSSRVTEAIAYSATGDRLDIDISYSNKSIENFALHQNTPNPFDEVTLIGFELPDAGNATITIFDITGKMVSKIAGNYNSGYNEITLQKEGLNSNGVMYYQLVFHSNIEGRSDFTATRKMIVLD